MSSEEQEKNKIDSCLPLNVNSWHYKFNKFIWGEHWDQEYDYVESSRATRHNGQTTHVYKDKPINLCPYMRRLVAGMILLPLVLLIRGIQKIPSPNIKGPRINIQWPDISYQTEDKILRIGKWTLVGLALIGAFVGSILNEDFRFAMYLVGGTIAGILLAVFIGIVIHEWWNDYKRDHPKPYKREVYKEPKPTPQWIINIRKWFKNNFGIFKTYIHAKHKKICPCLERTVS